jgi:hypothetical protein
MTTFAAGRRRRASKPARRVTWAARELGRQTCDSASAEIRRSDKFYCTHYLSPSLSGRKQHAACCEAKTRLRRRSYAEILRDSECSEYGAYIESASFLFTDVEQALCLPCACLYGREFLPSGDMALTLRSAKYSGRNGGGSPFQPFAERYSTLL